MREARHDLPKRHRRQLRGGDISTCFGQHFDPQPKSRRIEVLIEPRPRRLPEIEIEQMRQLRRRGLRHQLDAVLEPVRTDDAMQQLRPQFRCELGEAVYEFVWQVNESNEFTDAQPDCFGLDRRRTMDMGANESPLSNPRHFYSGPLARERTAELSIVAVFVFSPSLV
jgi:hypothetical protein